MIDSDYAALFNFLSTQACVKLIPVQIEIEHSEQDYWLCCGKTFQTLTSDHLTLTSTLQNMLANELNISLNSFSECFQRKKFKLQTPSSPPPKGFTPAKTNKTLFLYYVPFKHSFITVKHASVYACSMAIAYRKPAKCLLVHRVPKHPPQFCHQNGTLC